MVRNYPQGKVEVKGMLKNYEENLEDDAAFSKNQTPSFGDFIWRNIPGLQAFFLVNDIGEINYQKTSDSFDTKTLNQVNELIPCMVEQFQNLNTAEDKNQLNLTVSVFEDSTVLTSPLVGGFLLFLVVPNDTSYADSVNFVTSLQRLT